LFRDLTKSYGIIRERGAGAGGPAAFVRFPPFFLPWLMRTLPVATPPLTGVLFHHLRTSSFALYLRIPAFAWAFDRAPLSSRRPASSRRSGLLFAKPGGFEPALGGLCGHGCFVPAAGEI